MHVLDSDFCDPEFLARYAHKLSPVIVEIMGYGWHEINDDGEDLPPAQDPVAFFETATEFLWQMQFPDRKRESDARLSRVFISLTVSLTGRSEAEDMNPWGVNQIVEPWVTGPPTFTVVEDDDRTPLIPNTVLYLD